MSADHVTVIVPLHNKERNVRQCLKSIMTQSHKDIEILVVNDASTDRSAGIVHTLAASDSRIRVIDLPERSGAQKARYVGVDEARGGKLTFVDADDMLKPKAVAMMADTMDSLGVDLVQMRFRRKIKCFTFNYREIYNPGLTGRRIEGEDYRSIASYVGMDSYINPSACAKLYRTHLLRTAPRTKFDRFWGDDQILNIDYLGVARSMAFISYVGYLYRWGGATTRYQFSALRDYKNVYLLKMRLGQDKTCLDAELLQLLRYYIRQLNTELGWTREAVTMYLEQELADPVWRRVASPAEAARIVDAEFLTLQQNALRNICKRLLR